MYTYMAQFHTDKPTLISKPYFGIVDLVRPTIQRYENLITLQTYLYLFLKFFEKCNE